MGLCASSLLCIFSQFTVEVAWAIRRGSCAAKTKENRRCPEKAPPLVPSAENGNIYVCPNDLFSKGLGNAFSRLWGWIRSWKIEAKLSWHILFSLICNSITSCQLVSILIAIALEKSPDTLNLRSEQKRKKKLSIFRALLAQEINDGANLKIYLCRKQKGVKHANYSHHHQTFWLWSEVRSWDWIYDSASGQNERSCRWARGRRWWCFSRCQYCSTSAINHNEEGRGRR